MNRMLPVYWFKRLVAGDGQAMKFKLLREQLEILSNGLETSAEVIHADLQNDRVGSLVIIKLMLKLRKADGSYIYTSMASLVTLRDIPCKGQLLHIKYLPDNMDSVVIL